jgi:hypothetical protein
MILTLRIGIQMLLAPGENCRKTSKQNKFLPYKPALVAQYKLEHLTEDPKLKGSYLTTAGTWTRFQKPDIFFSSYWLVAYI